MTLANFCNLGTMKCTRIAEPMKSEINCHTYHETKISLKWPFFNKKNSEYIFTQVSHAILIKNRKFTYAAYSVQLWLQEAQLPWAYLGQIGPKMKRNERLTLPSLLCRRSHASMGRDKSAFGGGGRIVF